MRANVLQTAPLLVSLSIAAPLAAQDAETPRVLDGRLRIDLVAEQPRIVTPIGIDIDAAGRLFVLESHTHLTGEDHPGPKHDRVKRFTDADGDGLPETATVFAGGFEDGMNLSIGPDGAVYVCWKHGVIAFRDTDGDGAADERRHILRLETDQSYDHSCLLGVTCGPDGWLYVSRGNLGGYPYTYHGADGRTLAGYGEGGDIVRIRPDGSGLQPVATGFWNPFDLAFDSAGRLIAADNDPDARGPNRLVHVVRGGDYGFKAMYGPSGNHPYQAWDGELPGTLPLLAGTGEAPSGVLDADRAALPPDYRGNLLATIWAEHTIERFRPEPAGASLRAPGREVWVRGGRSFRPVGIAAAPDGSIYITDWVQRHYPNHGHGRIWRIRAKEGVAMRRPRGPFEVTVEDDGLRRIESLRDAGRDRHSDLESALRDDDPFIRSAAIHALSARPFDHVRSELARSRAFPRVRLGMLLAAQRSGRADPRRYLAHALRDRDPQVRIAALIWTGQSLFAEPSADPNEAIRVLGESAEDLQLFEVYLATRQLLTDRERELRERKTNGFGIRRELADADVLPLLRETNLPATARAAALRYVSGADDPTTRGLLIELTGREHETIVRRQAIRSLAGADDHRVDQRLMEIARTKHEKIELIYEAIAALEGRPADVVRPLVALLDRNPSWQRRVLRVLRHRLDDPRIADAVLAAYRRFEPRADPAPPNDLTTLDEYRFVIAADPALAARAPDARPNRPRGIDEWMRALRNAGPGDTTLGYAVFRSPSVGCIACHTAEGRGGKIGPDLSRIAASADYPRIVRSIIDPSEEVSPRYQAYMVTFHDGRVLTGTQFHYRGTDRASLVTPAGEEVRFGLDEVASHRPIDISYMPRGLQEQMSIGMMKDLVAYLQTLR